MAKKNDKDIFELKMLEQAVQALDALDADEQKRAIEYLSSRYSPKSTLSGISDYEGLTLKEKRQKRSEQFRQNFIASKKPTLDPGRMLREGENPKSSGR